MLNTSTVQISEFEYRLNTYSQYRHNTYQYVVKVLVCIGGLIQTNTNMKFL